MTFKPERFIGLVGILLIVAVAALAARDWSSEANRPVAKMSGPITGLTTATVDVSMSARSDEASE